MNKNGICFMGLLGRSTQTDARTLPLSGLVDGPAVEAGGEKSSAVLTWGNDVWLACTPLKQREAMPRVAAGIPGVWVWYFECSGYGAAQGGGSSCHSA